MRNFIKATFIILVLLIQSCASKPEQENEITETTSVNPLDSILGEKILNEEKGEIRGDNFSDFLALSKGN